MLFRFDTSGNNELNADPVRLDLQSVRHDCVNHFMVTPQQQTQALELLMYSGTDYEVVPAISLLLKAGIMLEGEKTVNDWMTELN